MFNFRFVYDMKISEKNDKGQLAIRNAEATNWGRLSGRKIREVGRAIGIHEATVRTKLRSGQMGPPKLGQNQFLM